jgi:uncharacterized membrane protein YhaH (DUF805 family)
MEFMEAVKTCLFDKYATFEGRATRSEYWWFLLFCFISGTLAVLIDPIVWLIFSLLILIPSIACQVRRLHDINKSGCYLFIRLVPLVGGIILFIWYLKKSYPEDNKYGSVQQNN